MRLPRAFSIVSFTILLVAGGVSAALCQQSAETTAHAISATPDVAVGPQYDTTHVYIAPEDFDRFVSSVLSDIWRDDIEESCHTRYANSQQHLLTVDLDACRYDFRIRLHDTRPISVSAWRRTGYLVTDMGTAIRAARQTGADILVTPFNDPIGQDAVIQWPGGVNMQLYSHFTPPSYKPLETVPENRVYVSADRADSFVQSFLAFSHGKVVSNDDHAPGVEIGRPKDTYRRIRITSTFAKLTVLVTDGQLPYPYGREVTGYEVANLADTLAKAKGARRDSFGCSVSSRSAGGRYRAIPWRVHRRNPLTG